MTKLNGQKPITGHKATAEELIALFALPDPPPNALSYELHRTSMPTLTALAYARYGDLGNAVPDALASAAYDEIERRERAVSNLLAACPGLRPA